MIMKAHINWMFSVNFVLMFILIKHNFHMTKQANVLLLIKLSFTFLGQDMYFKYKGEDLCNFKANAACDLDS